MKKFDTKNLLNNCIRLKWSFTIRILVGKVRHLNSVKLANMQDKFKKSFFYPQIKTGLWVATELDSFKGKTINLII